MFSGLDLQGNTFWEFRDTLSSQQNRMRRIVQYPASTHLSEIKITPQWHQWLRHTRNDPPSLAEQSQDLVRQENLKVLAAQADARWAAKGSFLGAPDKRADTLLGTEAKAPRGNTVAVESRSHSGPVIAIDGEPEAGVRGEGINAGQAIDAGVKPAGQIQVPDGTRHPSVQGAGHDRSTQVREKKEKHDPWNQARGGPSETWQPEAWGNIATPRQ